MNEKILWTGRQSINVRLKSLVLYFLFSWILSFGILIPLELVFNLVLYRTAPFAITTIGIFTLIILAIGIIQNSDAIHTEFVITNLKILEKIEENGVNHTELLLSEICEYKIKKDIFDVKKKNTGSIHFYTSISRKQILVFKHIEQIENVLDLIQELIPNKKVNRSKLSESNP